MLLEALEYLLTPCPAYARRLGHLAESVAIGARRRRCRKAWREHLERSAGFIRRAAEAAPGHGLAVVAGSGGLHDIPLRELASRFRRVVLLDLVHPLPARLSARRLGNVECRTVDVTDTLREVSAGRLPSPPMPDLCREENPDFVVSANILAQLPLLPGRRLLRAGHPPQAVEAFGRALMDRHLDWLRQFPGRICLTTDILWREGDETHDPLGGLALPVPAARWSWVVAPRPEIHPDRDVIHDVAGFLL